MYIIGADNKYPWTHLKSGYHRFDENIKSYFTELDETLNQPAMGATWEMNIAYEYAEKISKKLGFKIYNATRGGYLNAFERIVLEDVLSKEKA